MKKLRTCGATALQRHENVAITSKTCSTISATGRYVPLSAATPPLPSRVGGGGRTDGDTRRNFNYDACLDPSTQCSRSARLGRWLSHVFLCLWGG